MQNSGRDDHKFETIMKEIERDAQGYPTLLENTWPQDIAYSRRILGAILAHLKSKDIPKLHWAGRFASIQDHSGAVPVAQAALNALQQVIRHTRDKQDLLVGLLDGLQDDLWGLLSWLQFISLRSAPYVAILTMAERRYVPEFTVCTTASTILCWLPRALEYVEVEESFLKELAKSMLLVWIGSPRLGEQDLETPGEYGSLTCTLSGMFSACLNVPSTGFALLQHVNELDLRTSKRLSNSFIRHCQKWEEIWKAGQEMDVETAYNGFAVLVILAHELAGFSRRFYKTLSGSEFPSISLRATLAYPGSMSTKLGNKVPPLAVRIVGNFLDRSRPISESIRTIPGLLKIGLLTVVVQTLLVNYGEQKGYFKGEDGLWFLLDLCNRPPITDSLASALATVPSDLVTAVNAKSNTRSIWSRFLLSVEIFQKGYHFKSTPGSCAAYLCDNLEHDSTQSPSAAKINAFQCAGCGTAVYCSEECQRKDWKPYHRGECDQARAYRIECQLDGVWLSPRMRTTLLRLPEFWLHKTLPALRRAREESQQPELNQITLVEVHYYPVRTLLLDVESVLKMSLHGRPVFGDQRSQDLLRRRLSTDSIEVVATMACFGRYFIATLSTFRIRGQDETVSGGSGQGHDGLTLLNQYVKLLKRAHGPSGVYDLTIPDHCLKLNPPRQETYIG